MPELIYNVKFEVDSSNLQKITSGIDPSSSKQVQDLEKSYDDLKNKFKELKNSMKGGSVSGGAIGGASTGFLDLMQNVKTTTSEVRKNTSSFKKSIVTTDQSTDSFIQQSEALLTGSIELQRLREELEQAAQQENLTDKQTEQLNNTINSLANVQRSAVSASNNFNDGLQVIEHQAGTMNKAFAGSNQLLFSFSDLVQDSTQFSQGFAQGMRAIGNNIGFTAELFANLSNNVKRHNKLVADGTLKNEKQITTYEALKQSLKGAGGALIAINGVVMAATLLFQMLDKRVKKAKESAQSLGEAFLEINKEFSQIDTGAPDPLGFRARGREIDLLTTKVSELTENFKQTVIQSTAIGMAGTAAGGFLSLVGIFKGASDTVLDYAGAIGIVDEEHAKFINQNEFLRETLKELIEQQTAYTILLEQPANKALKNFVELTEDYEKVLAEQLGGVELTTKSLDDMAASTTNQINALRQKNQLTDQEIGVLFQLLELQVSINNERLKEIEFISRLQGVRDQEALVAENINLLKEESNFNKFAIEKRIRDKDIELSFNQEKAKIEKDLLLNKIDDEKAATMIEALESLKRTKLRQSELTEQKQIEQERRDVISSSLDMAANFVGAFGALKQQEIQNELQAAKARGASADELDRINRKKFRAEKRAQIASTIINTASAVVEALPNQGLAIATAALGAIQLATIRKTKYGSSGSISSAEVPKAEGGSFIQRTGEENLPVSSFLGTNSKTKVSSSFIPRSSQAKESIEVTVVNTFNESTVAEVSRIGGTRLRSSQLSV